MENRSTATVTSAKEIRKAFAKKERIKSKLLNVSDFSEILETLERKNESLDIERVMQEKLILIGENEVKEAEEERRKAEEERRKAEIKVKHHKNALKELQLEYEQIEAQKQKMCEELTYFKKMKKQFNNTVLIHNSATTKQIITNSNGKIIATKRDAGLLQDKGIVIDQKFNPIEAEHLIEYIPEGIEEKYDSFMWNRIVDFCEMVANFKMAAKSGEEDKIILLYSNIDIAEILKTNGLYVY